MRNLRNIKHAVIQLGDEASPLTATAWDSTGLVCSFGPTGSNSEITLKRLSRNACSIEQAVLIASWDAPSPNPDLNFDRVLNLHCFPDIGTICVVLEGGDIVIIRENMQHGQELIEIVGSVDVGISAAAWSPDEELLLIATKADTVLFMTREFEGTATVTLSSEDLKGSSHVSVGWGKRETQFQGRNAKILRDPTVPDHVDEGKLSEMDDGQIHISWRGDGQFVAVNSILDRESRRRVIRVFSREGALDSVSEPVDGLEGALSWKPSGQLIAGVQRRGDKIDVVFFERNGLRHGEFSLRLSLIEMDTMGSAIGLDWNSDSTVLAVSLKNSIQLWTMGNYHYYLKQEIRLDVASSQPARCSWHAERPLQLTCFTGDELRVLNFNFDLAHGSVVPPHDHGIVAVIDGRRINITPLRTANVPPPMSFDEIELPQCIVDVAINKQGTRIAVLHADFVSWLECDYSCEPVNRARITSQISLSSPTPTSHSISRQLAFASPKKVIVAASSVNMTGTRLISLSDDRAPAVKDVDEVISLFNCNNHDKVMYESSTGAIFQIDELFHSLQIGRLQNVCPTTAAWYEGKSVILFGLTTGGTLHIKSDTQILKVHGCTSMATTNTHLVYTTSQHLLKFVHLHIGELDIPADEPEKDERCRNIERGAKVVTVIPSVYALVLQMPRGNLETIYPRALVLAGIRQAIGHQDYKKAFLICRTQRVDMNILHDYAPAQFMRDVDLLIRQVKKAAYIDLILSSLSEDDVSQTLYKDTFKMSSDYPGMNGTIKDDAHPQTTPAATKVNRICDAFLDALRGQKSSYLQSIVTAHVSKSPPDLEAGLSLIAELRKQGTEEQLEQAIEHICFLADVNQLYDTALGLYDLDVALLVAQQSQKDPREYLPYLQNLHDMPQLRRHHSIDNDLKRYQKALIHLHTLGEFEELKGYAAKHNLYSTAIELYRYDNTRLTELMKIYAEFLNSRNEYKEAGIVYEYISDYESARDAYRACAMWRECLACAGLVNMPDESVSEIARELAESLEEAKDYAAAATVHLEHLQGLKPAVKLLCRGYQFSDAIRQIALKHQPELLQDLVDPGLIEASANMTELLAEMKTQLHTQVPRLRELRKKKEEDPMGFLDGGGGDYDDVPDNISLAPTDTTTGGTFMTRYTNRSTGTLATNATRKTSKNRRREERKRARGKQGTVYEEEYLVNSIARLIERLNAVGDDVSKLLEGLMRRTMRERAVAVDAAFQEVVASCKASMNEVFAPAAAPTQPVEGAGERPWGGQGVLWEAMAATQQKTQMPVLRGFQRLGLLEK